MSARDTGRGGATVDVIHHEGIVSELNVTPTALVFVRVVPAVVVVVALPATWHAAVVLTSKLVRLTCPLSCTNYRKRDSAKPSHHSFDTLVPRMSLQCIRHRDALTALLFRLIRCVATVVLAVTLPARRDAAPRVFAAELVHTARHLGWRGRRVTFEG